MRHWRMLLLHFEHTFEYRSRNFVWFLVELVNPLLILLYWYWAIGDRSGTSLPISASVITAYYFWMIFAGAILSVHIEEDVAVLDIQEGGLSRYLLRPFPYFLLKFYEELPWRLIQGIFGLIIIAGFAVIFRIFDGITPLTWGRILLIIETCIAGYTISFLFKMIVGLSAFWVTDYQGLHQFTEVVMLAFAGFLVPLDIMPEGFRTLANILPFPYMIYYPVMAMIGRIDSQALPPVIIGQMVWLIILGVVSLRIWKAGTRLYAGVGQ